MEELVRTFLIMIAGMSNYGIPNDVPVVQQVPVNLLQELACESKKCPIAGWFPGGNTVYIDSTLDVDLEPTARGILFHELVHFVQYNEDPSAWTNNRTCENVQRMEFEAYKYQQQYMQQVEHVFKPVWGMRYKLQC